MRRNAETNRDILKCIVALLFALAELADRASLARSPVRYQMLSILRMAEAVAQAFVIGKARDLGVSTPLQASLDSDDPDDMTRLALSLRILALALAGLLARAERCASQGSGHITVVKIEVLRQLVQPAARRSQNIPPPDTS